MAIFPSFSFRQYRPDKCVLRYSRTKRTTFQAKKTTRSKRRKTWDFSRRVNPFFCSKNSHFSNLFFLGNIGQENVFYDILERKNAFLGYKNNKFKTRNIEIFPKGLTHGFSAKMAIFPTFFFGNIGQETAFCDILERKTVFLGCKNKKFRKSKNWDFSKGVYPWF